MSFLRRLSSIMPAFGQPMIVPGQTDNQGVALSGTAQQTSTVPSSGSLASPIQAGRMRVKISGATGTSPTLTDLVVTGTDGTNTVYIGQMAFHPTVAVPLSATASFEYEGEFITDIACTSFSFKTTLGGTTPAATGDFEVCGSS